MDLLHLLVRRFYKLKKVLWYGIFFEITGQLPKMTIKKMLLLKQT